MITLKNKKITVTIAELGAEMQSIIAADGTEYLWQGDANYWEGHAPVLFPICGRLFDEQYRWEGETYFLPIHGFANSSVFEVEVCTDTEVVFLLKDSEETRRVYPFAFELRVRYALEGTSVAVEYSVHNPSDKTLVASVGSHEGYACPEGVDEYEVVFEQNELLRSQYNSRKVGGRGISPETYPVDTDNGVLALRDVDFAKGSLMFRELHSRAVTLRNRQTGRGVTVAFDEIEMLLFWTIPGAPYVCIEPWWGLPCWEDFSGELSEKDGMQYIAAGDTYTARHTITVLP